MAEEFRWGYEQEIERLRERIANLEAGRELERQALRNALDEILRREEQASDLIRARDQALADRARDRRVVEAAMAVVDHLHADTTRDGSWFTRNQELLDALDTAVREVGS